MPTQRLGFDGQPISPVRIDLSFGTKTQGYKPVSVVSLNNSTGKFFLRPMYNESGFSGVMGLVRASDGRILKDDFLRERALKVVLDSSECNNNGLPTTGPGCGVSDVYNVELDWLSCDGPGSDGPSYTALGREV